MPALIPSLCSGDPAQTGEMTGYTVPLELGEAGVCGRPNALIKNLAPLTPSREWVRWGRILVQMSAHHPEPTLGIPPSPQLYSFLGPLRVAPLVAEGVEFIGGNVPGVRLRRR